MSAFRPAGALSAFAATCAVILTSAIPPGAAAAPGTARVVLDEDPPPVVDLRKLSPAVANLFCSTRDKACAKEGSRAIAEAKGWVETPRVDVNKVIADCESRSRIAAQNGDGVSAFRICLSEGRPSTLWLPAAGFRLPRTGWFAFSWSRAGDCSNGNDGCFTSGLVDLATGAMALREEMPPTGEDEPVRIETMTGDVSLERARTSALLAVLAPHAVRRRVAIAAPIPPELVPQGTGVITQPGRMAFIQSVFGSNLDYRWAWLSPAGEVWAHGVSSSPTTLSNLVAGYIRHLPHTLVPGCPTSRPGMNAAAIRSALEAKQDVAPFAELRAAFGQCRGERR